MNLFELRSQFGGAAVVAGAENKIEKFFEGGGMTRGAAQNGLEQSDGLLRETVAGKQVYVGERLCDESLRLLVQLRIEWRGRSLRPVCDFRTEPAYIGAQLGRGSLGYFGSQMILGNSGDFVRDIGCRRQAQLAQNVIEFAFHRLAAQRWSWRGRIARPRRGHRPTSPGHRACGRNHWCGRNAPRAIPTAPAGRASFPPAPGAFFRPPRARRHRSKGCETGPESPWPFASVRPPAEPRRPFAAGHSSSRPLRRPAPPA